MFWIRLLNWLKIREDTLICIRQEDTYCWPSHLGKQTEGVCSQCNQKIYFEKQNKSFKKVCNHCAWEKI
jgi:hypothetical protein